MILSDFLVPHLQEVQQRPGQSHVVEKRQNHHYTCCCYHSKYTVADFFSCINSIFLLIRIIRIFVSLSSSILSVIQALGKEVVSLTPAFVLRI